MTVIVQSDYEVATLSNISVTYIYTAPALEADSYAKILAGLGLLGFTARRG
jgi:hypothetical protein